MVLMSATGRYHKPNVAAIGDIFRFAPTLTEHQVFMVRMRLLISFSIEILATLAGAQALATENLDMRDNGFSSSKSDSAADALDASTTGSATDEMTVPPDTLAPSSTTPPVAIAQPIVGGVKMFGQCGGIFYTGTIECYDPDAYCKQLSIYSSICSPKPDS